MEEPQFITHKWVMYAELKLSPARPDAREQWYLSIDPGQKLFGVYTSRTIRPTFPEPFATANVIPCGEQSSASNTTTEKKQHNARTALVSCFGSCRRRLRITGTKQGTSRRTVAQTAHVEPQKTHRSSYGREPKTVSKEHTNPTLPFEACKQ